VHGLIHIPFRAISSFSSRLALADAVVGSSILVLGEAGAAKIRDIEDGLA